MKKPQCHPSLVALVLLICFLSSCLNGHERRAEADRMRSLTKSFSEVKAGIEHLEIRRKEAQSFIESAEVHQVTRTEREKARQLSNLHLYMGQIEFKIDSLRQLVTMYEDSIHVR